MWSLKITTEQRYKYFEPILPDIKTDIKLFFECVYNSQQYDELKKINFFNLGTHYGYNWLDCHFKSFIIERTLDNQYQITFYE